MSYHNGSVWPHDNALIALGMARMGLRAEAVRLLEAMCAAADAMDLSRLPELFCGFHRRPGQGPTSYPVACAPQAWATACIPGLVQACLGISFDPAAHALHFNYPVLPPFLTSLYFNNVTLGGSRVERAGAPRCMRSCRSAWLNRVWPARHPRASPSRRAGLRRAKAC